MNALRYQRALSLETLAMRLHAQAEDCLTQARTCRSAIPPEELRWLSFDHRGVDPLRTTQGQPLPSAVERALEGLPLLLPDRTP